VQIFESFASFGDRLSNGALMDSKNFAKVARDCKRACRRVPPRRATAGDPPPVGAHGVPRVLPRPSARAHAPPARAARPHSRRPPARPPARAVLDAILSPTQVDLIFARVKPRGARKIDFAAFQRALDVIAGVKFGNDPDGPAALRAAVVYAGGPLLDNVHLPRTDGVFDKLTDTALFTGASRERFDGDGNGRGAAGRFDGAGGGVNAPDLASFTRPDYSRGGTHLSSASAARRTAGGVGAGAALGASGASAGGGAGSPGGSPRWAAGGSGGGGGSPGGGGGEGGAFSARGGGDGGGGSSRLHAAAAAAAAASAAAAAAAAPAPSAAHGARAPVPRVVIESAELRSVFLAYAAFGSTARYADELDSAKFAKLARETGLAGGAVGPAAVDLAFARVKPRGARTVSYDAFQQALAILAPLRFPDLDIVGALQSAVEMIVSGGGPVYQGAPPEPAGGVYNRLADPAHFTASARAHAEDGAGGDGRGY